MNAHETGCVSAIASLSGVGPSRLRGLLQRGSPSEVWNTIVSGAMVRDGETKAMLGSNHQALVTSWTREAQDIDPYELARAQAERGIALLTSDDPDFPAKFRDDPEPPYCIWAVGNRQAIRSPCVAIVGTRRCTRYGHDTARSFGAVLAQAGVTVVSGLALGIDAAAHAGVLQVAGSGAPPVAVVGTGVDVVYPSRNRTLWNDVATKGLILSESPPGARADAWRFPARNRLIAALADIVVVVESQERGGSMYTVDEAIARDIEVRAVPGPINTPSSAGTNRLISDGASPALCPEEILEQLGCVHRPQGSMKKPLVVSREAEAVLAALFGAPATLNDIAEVTNLSLGAVAVGAAELESSGQIVRSGGWYERSG